MKKIDFLNKQKNGGVKIGSPIFTKPGRPSKPDSEKLTEKVTITLTPSEFENLKKNVGVDRNKTAVLRSVLKKSGILNEEAK